MACIGQVSDASTDLLRLEQELDESLAKTLTKDDLIKLEDIDDGVVAFIEFVRRSMEWGEKPLKGKDVEVIFGVLDEEHKKIMAGLTKLIKDFVNRGEPNPFLEDEKKKAKK